jgi:hypothetical protein|nr:MAG TPA: Large polyvalent protein associated domain 23 [Caudoviricetes sp.]
MANCSIIRNPNTNYIEKVLAPNGKESLLYKRALEHLRDVKDDVIVNRSTNENEFLFQENGVTVTLKRRDGSDVYLEQINSESDFSTENVFKRVLDFFDKQGVTLFVDKNNTFSEKLIVNSGFVENQEQPFSLIREREEFKAIPSEQLKEQALTLWSIAYTDAFSETIGKWNFTEEELAKEKSFINQRKREIKQVRAYNAAKSQIIAERYQNLQKQGAQYQVLNDNLNNEELFDSEIIKEQQKLQNEVLNRIQEVFSKKFHNFNIVQDINSFSKLLEDDNLLKTYSGKVIGAVLDDGTVFIDKNNFSIETPIHEASHLWEKLNPQLWEKGVETLKEALPKNKELQDIVDFVKSSQTHLSEEQVYSEALNDFIGKWGEKKINENNGDLKKLLNWLKDFFNDIFKLFNPEVNKQKELEDFSKMVVTEIVGEKPLQSSKSMFDFLNKIIPQFQIVGKKGIQNFNDAEKIEKLKIAIQMKEEGFSEQQIWLETGWQHFKDGWKTEIEDGQLKNIILDFSKNKEGFSKNVAETTLSEIYENDNLYNLYPSLKDLKVVFYQEDGVSENDNSDAFVEDGILYLNFNSYEGANKNNKDAYIEAENLVVHEIQHLIQQIEGFERGGSAELFTGQVDELFNEIRDLLVGGTETDRRNAERLLKFSGLKQAILDLTDLKEDTDVLRFAESPLFEEYRTRFVKRAAMYNYFRMAGEVEARNAVRRSNIKYEDIKDFPLTSSQDVFEGDKIYIDTKDNVKIPERFQLSVEEIFGYNTEDLKPVPVLSVSKYLEDKYETDNNGEPHLKDVLVMDTIMRNWKAAVTPAEIYKLSNDFGDVVDSVEELYQEINKTFFPNGYFQIKEDLLFESKLYSQGEAILLLTHPEIQQNVQRLFEAVRKEYMSNNTYLENTLNNSKFSEELVQYKDEVDDLGKVQKEDPVEVENYLKQNLAGVKDRQLFNMIVSNLQEYLSFKKRFTNDLAFSEAVFDKYSKMNKVIRFQDIKGQITPRIKGNRFATMFETLQFSDKGLEVGQDSKFLRHLDNFIWETQGEEIKNLLREIEEKLIDYNIDVIGLSEQYDKKSKTEMLDFIDNIYNFTEKLRSNDYIAEDIQTLSYDIDSFFGKDSVNTDSFYLKVSENNREKTLVELSSEKSDLELFEEQNLIKTSDGFYQKVNVKPTLEEAYDDAVQIIIDNPKIINNYFLKGLPFFKSGMFNRTEVQKSENRELIKDAFKNFIRQEASKLNDPVVKKLTETAQKWTIYKLMNKNPLNTEKLPNFAKEQLKYQMFNGNYHYLTNNFHSDFQNYILKNKFENTSLYNNVLKYFEVTESGIRLTTDSSQIKDRIKNTYITDSIFENLKQYSILSKHPSMQDLFEYENDGIRNNSAVEFERFYNSNNFSQMKSFKGDYRVDGDILVANNVSDNFIRVAEGLFEKVGQIEGNSVYGRQTIIENPNVNNYEYKLQHPNIDFEIARSMVLKTNAVESKSIKSYDRQEETILKQEYNECG